MKTSFILPYEITFFGLSKEAAELTSNTYSDAYFIHCDSRLKTASIRSILEKSLSWVMSRSAIYKLMQNNDFKLEDLFDKITVRNENFHLEIDVDRYRIYTNFIPVRIRSKEIDAKSNGRPVILTMSMRVFTDLIKATAGNIVDFAFPGTYFLNGENIAGDASNIISSYKGVEIYPVLNDPGNEELKQAIDAGRGMLKRLTSNWIPGHLYMMRNKKKVLYLGEFSGFSHAEDWLERQSGENSIRLVRDMLDYPCTRLLKKSRLCVIVESDYQQEILDKFKGMDIINFIKTNIVDSRAINYLFRDSSKPKWTGQDLGEFLTGDPSHNYCEAIKNICRGELLSFKGSSKDINKRLFNFYPEILNESKAVRDFFLEYKKQRAIEQLSGSWYFKSGNISIYKNKPLTLEELLRLINTGKIYSDCIKDIVFQNNIYETITVSEDEIKNMQNDVVKGLNNYFQNKN